MKKYWVLLLLPFFWACSSSINENEARVNLYLKNTELQELQMGYLKNYLLGDREIISAQNDGKGNFSYTLQLDMPVYAHLLLAEQMVTIYLEPGKNLDIQLDGEKDANPVYRGGLAAENNFLQKYQEEIEPVFGMQALFAKFGELQPDAFSEYAQHMYDFALSLMEDFHRSRSLSPAFRQYFVTDVTFEVYRHKLNYPLYHQYNRKLDSLPQMPEGFYDFTLDALASLDQHEFLITSVGSYISTLLQYFWREYVIRFEDYSYPDFMMVMASEKMQGDAQLFTQAYAINTQFTHGEYDKAVEDYKKFIAESSWEYLNQSLEATYNHLSRGRTGSRAPEFTLTDIYGNEVSLSDFRNKVVYLDFWASWCGPCMREIPYARELKKRFEGTEDLVFLYISIDEDDFAWRHTVTQNNIEGIHLNVKGFQDELVERFNVRGVPTFFIIDRNGMIYDNNPGRPSSEGIYEKLRAALL